MRLLAIHLDNLGHLEFQAAQYSGPDIPIHLLHKINYTYEQICHRTRELQRKEGLLAELEKLRFALASEHVATTKMGTLAE